MARWWFFLVLLNSSSFSATLLSISCLTCPSSSCALSTLFSSCSRVPSASSRAPCSSSFSCSSLLLCLSRSCMERPPSPSWSSKSLIICKILILTLDNVQLLHSLLSSSLQSEEFRAIVTTFVLGSCHFTRNITSFGLPLAQNLVEVLASLLSDESSSMNPLVLHADIVQISSHPGLRLLSIGYLSSKNIHQLLTFYNLGL